MPEATGVPTRGPRRRRAARALRVVAGALWLGVVFGAGVACAPVDAPSSSPSPSSSPPPSAPSPSASDGALGEECPPIREPETGVAFDRALHEELVAMLARDQAGRTGTGVDDEGDPARTERLREILADHGWPGFDLVGEDGEDAAWAIAQHSDLDPLFQECALAHLRVAVGAGQGSPGNLAYLDDRIAVAAGEPQRYGTQVGCGAAGPEPATPLVDAERVDDLRADAGLGPYEEYMAEMAAICEETG